MHQLLQSSQKQNCVSAEEEHPTTYELSLSKKKKSKVEESPKTKPLNPIASFGEIQRIGKHYKTCIFLKSKINYSI